MLKLENFKAFNTFCLNLARNNGGELKNAIIYGENGSGKTSIFEAVKLFYFKNRILEERIPSNVVGEERENQIQQIFDDYKNNITKNIIVEVDNEIFTSHDNSTDNTFLISYNDLDDDMDELSIEKIIRKSYLLNTNNDTSQDWDVLTEAIVEETNTVLKNIFWMEDVKLHLISGANKCSITNVDNRVPKQANLTNFFNEGLLHVIRFVILVESAVYFSATDRQALLVLDDCFNSLDMQNRTFIIRYLLQRTQKMQRIIFTHNIGFFNLFNYIANNSSEDDSEWDKFMLCRINGIPELITQEEDDVKKLRNALTAENVVEIGNKLRRLFEILIYKISRLTNIGELQETRCLLDRLCSSEDVYLSVEGDKLKNVYDLVNEIYANVTNGNEYDLAKRLQEKIATFRKHDFLKVIRPALEELRLMQKVALHQASHGTEGVSSISSKELKVALSLLEKIEKAVNTATSQTKRIDTSV